MSHRHSLTLLGLVLITIGLFERGWLLLVVWLGCDFLALGIAHARGAHRVFGKRSDGSLPIWSWSVFLPLLLYTNAVWHISRLLCRGPILTEWQGLTQEAMARKLGLSISGAKSRVQRARSQLKELLLDCCRFEIDRRGNVLEMHPRRKG